MALRLRDVSASLILAILTVLAWPVTPWSLVPYKITITATGAKDARSHGAEVWLNRLPTGLDPSTLLASRTSPQGWEQRGEGMVSYRDQPSSLHFSGTLPGDGAFVFGRHDWSGNVTIEVNGVRRSADLFDDTGSAAPFVVALSEFPVASRLTWDNRAHFFSLVLIAAAAILGVFLALRAIEPRAPSPPSISYRRDVFRYALPALLIFSLVLLGTWPAQMSPDSVSQWAELARGGLTNAHPIVHTVLTGGPGYLLGSPGWSMALQIILLALACGALAAEIRRWGISALGTWAIAILVPALPAVHLLSTVFWKDVPYAATLAGLTAMLMALVRTHGAITRRPMFMAGFAVLLFLAATLRHNGLVVSIGSIVLLGLLMRRQLEGRFLVLSLTAGAALPLLWTMVILPASGIGGLGRHYAGAVPLHLLGRMVAENRITDTETLARLDAILPLDSWKSGYNCLSVVPLFWAPGIKYEKIDETLFEPAVHAAMQNPVAALSHFLCVSSSTWRLSPTKHAVYSLVPLGIWKASPPLDRLGLAEAPVSTTLNDALKRELAATTATPARFVVFWRPALVLLVLGGMALLAWRRDNSGALVLIAAPVVLNIASMLPVTLSQDFRYQYPLYVVGPFLMAAFWGVRDRPHELTTEREAC